MNKLLLFTGALALTGLVTATQVAADTVAGKLDEMEAPPPGYGGPKFVPNYAFPATLPPAEARPWEQINYRTHAADYMAAVLAYVLEGQDKDRWVVANNPVRQWYHMPWMGPGSNGREYLNGLTAERTSRRFELGPAQTKCRQNWAVGFYNPVGGHALGKIWGPVASGASLNPDLSQLPFPAGTVVAKMLYTEANEQEVPLLAGAPTIEANIIRDDNPADDSCPPTTVDNKPAPRAPKTLRLLQLDIAVRDPNADGFTGWIFGTFVYDGRIAGSDPWTKLKPVGLMWGNDEDLSDDAAAGGKKPAQSIVLSKFGIGDAAGNERQFGRGDRMNGPVDNPVSSCLSCHMTAQTPSSAGMAPTSNAKWANAQCWFRTLGPATPFGQAPVNGAGCGTLAADQVSLDYSLQLAVGVRNAAIAEANADRGGIKLFGTTLFGRRPLSFDEPVVVDGAKSMPVTRE